jgi:hypothetical protein
LSPSTLIKNPSFIEGFITKHLIPVQFLPFPLLPIRIYQLGQQIIEDLLALRAFAS